MAAWLVVRFEDEEAYTVLESFAHLERVLDEQCYRIPELEAVEDEIEADTDGDNEDDDESPGWQPVRKFTTRTDESGADELQAEIPDEAAADENQNRVELQDAEDSESDSLQNPHDDEATFRRKRRHGRSIEVILPVCGG